jgi:hypothetical protein
VSFDIKTAFPGQLFLHLDKTAIGKIHDFAAAGTNQMMVMFRGSSHHVAPAPALGMDSANQIEFAKHVKSAVNGDQPDARVF